MRLRNLALSFFPLVLFVQSPELTLAVHKTMGLNNGSQIQGSFRLEVSGPADLNAVTFSIDGTEIGTVTAAPFRLSFRTDDYAPGWHELSAVGTTAGGSALHSPVRKFEFLSSEQAAQALQGILIPVFSAIGLAMLAGLAIQMAASLGGRKRSYGLSGGAVCPKCGRPFARHWWALNVSIAGKFDRCDHCGRWSLVRRATPEQLAAAEAAAMGPRPSAPPEPSAAEKLKRQLDDSRFTDQP